MLAACASISEAGTLTRCVHWQLMSYLAEPHWVARLFLYYLLPSCLLGGVWLSRSPRPVMEGVLVALAAGVWVAFVIDPPWLLMMGVASGCVLAGALVIRWRRPG